MRFPKDMAVNARIRRGLLEDAARDRRAAEQIKTECAKDIIFYVNGFCWTYDPRRMEPDIPFVTYPFQDDALLELVESVRNGWDVGVKKSRDMGASWICLTVAEWFWHFKAGIHGVMVSRTEDYVDKKGDPKSLFWKVDYLHRHQPKWLLPTNRWLGWGDPGRKQLHLENADNGSVLDGESTTGDVTRGDRCTFVLMDEFASFDTKAGYEALKASRDATRTRWFNSTPKGSANAFYDVIHKTAAKIVTLHWSKHPEKARGLYTSKDGLLQLLDEWSGVVEVRVPGEGVKHVRFPNDYPFVLDGKTRSPWYDNECARCVSPVEVGQELDIDFVGSDYTFFDAASIEAYKKMWCRAPAFVGNAEVDTEALRMKRLAPDAKGCFRLWERPDEGRGWKRTRRFVMGVDVSAGTGASNSTFAVYDRATKDKVAEYANPRILPADFAKVVFALGRWFNEARIVPDRSGPTGEVLVKRLLSDGYANLYYRRNERKLGRNMTDEPGVWLNPQVRSACLEEYRAALGDVRLLNRSERALDECLRFIRKMDGTIEHSEAANTQDPSGARSAHGDIVIADALANLELNGEPTPMPDVEPEIPKNCLASRMAEFDDARRTLQPGHELGEGW